MKNDSKVGNKYVIEIEQEYSANMRKGSNDIVEPVKLYKAKGFNSLVFDEQGLDKLKRMPELEQIDKQYEEIETIRQTAYENGLHDAWEIAKKIECMDGYNGDELIEMFGTDDIEAIFAKYKASEVLEKVKAYAEQKAKTFNDEVKVGDEIIVTLPCTNREIAVIAYKIEHINMTPMYYCISFAESRIYIIPYDKVIKRTGRHFPQITNLMSKISTP